MSAPQPQARVIKAEHVQLALAARKVAAMQVAGGQRGARWAAMSNGVNTQSCERRRAPWSVDCPPLMVPMHHGNLLSAVERTRLERGLAEVRRTWGCGLRALQAELADYCLPAEVRA